MEYLHNVTKRWGNTTNMSPLNHCKQWSLNKLTDEVLQVLNTAMHEGGDLKLGNSVQLQQLRPNIYLYVLRTKSLFKWKPTYHYFRFLFFFLLFVFRFFFPEISLFNVCSTSGSLWHSFLSWIGVCLVCWSIFTVIQGTVVSPIKALAW